MAEDSVEDFAPSPSAPGDRALALHAPQLRPHAELTHCWRSFRFPLSVQMMKCWVETGAFNSNTLWIYVRASFPREAREACTCNHTYW